MKRPLAFTPSLMTAAMDGLDAKDRAILASALAEVGSTDLKSQILTPGVMGTPICWDVCLATVFDDGIEVRHWSRIVRDRPPERFDLHGKVRRLSGGLGDARKSRKVAEKIKDIFARPATATLFFYAVARLEDGKTHETLWWHPSFTKQEARIALDSMVHYGLEEHA